MSSQPSTVEVDGYSITSANESADDMLEALKPEKPDSGEARITVREGVAVPIPEPKDKLAEAASELGKKGGKAAAEKRAEEARKAKPAEEEPEQKAKAEPAEEDAEDTDEAADIRKPSVKKRIETLAREKREAEGRAATERQERERLANEVERLRQAREPREQPQERKASERQAPQDDPEPNEDDFAEHAEYVKASARHAARQEFREQQQKVARQTYAHAFAQRVQETLSGYSKRIKAARTADPDFDARISADVDALSPSVYLAAGEPLQAGNVIADYIVHSEQAPALKLYLSENPNDFQRIASLGGPRDVERAMAKLEGRLDAATAGARVETEEVSQAKPPLRPVGGSPHTAADVEPSDDDDFDSWSRKMDAKEKRTKR